MFCRQHVNDKVKGFQHIFRVNTFIRVKCNYFVVLWRNAWLSFGVQEQIPHTTDPAPKQVALSLTEQAGLWMTGFEAGFDLSKQEMVPPEVALHELFRHGHHCGTLFRLGEVYKNQARRAARTLMRKKFGVEVKV